MFLYAAHVAAQYSHCCCISVTTESTFFEFCTPLRFGLSIFYDVPLVRWLFRCRFGVVGWSVSRKLSVLAADSRWEYAAMLRTAYANEVVAVVVNVLLLLPPPLSSLLWLSLSVSLYLLYCTHYHSCRRHFEPMWCGGNVK